MNIFNSYNDMFRLNNWCRNTNDPNFSLAKLENYDEVKLANIEYCYEPILVVEAWCLGFFNSWSQSDDSRCFSCEYGVIEVIHQPECFSIVITTKGGSLKKEVLYLNEIQNLWYFMTGYELDISPKYNYLSEVPILSDYIAGIPRPMNNKSKE